MKITMVQQIGLYTACILGTLACWTVFPWGIVCIPFVYTVCCIAPILPIIKNDKPESINATELKTSLLIFASPLLPILLLALDNGLIIRVVDVLISTVQVMNIAENSTDLDKLLKANSEYLGSVNQAQDMIYLLFFGYSSASLMSFYTIRHAQSFYRTLLFYANVTNPKKALITCIVIMISLLSSLIWMVSDCITPQRSSLHVVVDFCYAYKLGDFFFLTNLLFVSMINIIFFCFISIAVIAATWSEK
ncbi:hypothetical protein [Pseudovibrio sp. Tun.PSC04-5.I4]|uniref:hypothetical protein n=1 Tax=Pseudovibrio sp. Tun.PSC04-5.I4 TaxID=1798213 RepID=UPI0008879864|nr:hypothetical protein [Pseudovibrio sp. Tun.PSC04-5.I4]SDQ35518.1 hypothetical protein SAMN04515695_0942 [Pseudovibrio sp. Tun.PSC04-5.I4]SDQ37474.1 hypothetical protein SAMN04515695_1021 [Pseudovibrio sp. Tun.PSC04-5.I4]